MVTAKEKEIQSMTNLINANISISESHPELKEKLGDANESLRKQISELKKTPIKNKRVIKDSDQDNVVQGRCKAIIGGTNEPCRNAEAFGGYCLIHLKQRNPQMAEDFQRNTLGKKFGLTEAEIDKIKEVNGNLQNFSKGLAVFIKSQRNEQ